MNRKTLRALLLSLGLLLIAFAVVLMSGSLANDTVVASTPVYNAQSIDAAAELETISDSEVPLAAPLTAPATAPVAAETLVLTQTAVREDVPAVSQPAAQPPVQQEPAQSEPAPQDPAQQEPVVQEPAKEEPVSEEPVVTTSVAIRLLERANALLTQYNACTSMACWP